MFAFLNILLVWFCQKSHRNIKILQDLYKVNFIQPDGIFMQFLLQSQICMWMVRNMHLSVNSNGLIKLTYKDKSFKLFITRFRSWILVFVSRTPYSDCTIIRNRGQHLVMYRIPGNAVDCSGVASQSGNWKLTLDMPHIYFVVCNGQHQLQELWAPKDNTSKVSYAPLYTHAGFLHKCYLLVSLDKHMLQY